MKYQPKQYQQIRNALEFLYEESLRARSFELAEVILQALAGAEKLKDNAYNPAIGSKDALRILEFIQVFVQMSPENKLSVARVLSAME